MEIIIQKINKIAKLRLDTWFFYLLLATFTISIRKVLYFFPIRDGFNEYTGIYIYLSDIFLLLTIGFWLLNILCNNNDFQSNNITLLGRCSTWNIWIKKLLIIFHNLEHSSVSRGTISIAKKTYSHIVNNYLYFFPLFIAFFSFLSILWTTNKSIAFYKSIKLSELFLLYFYIKINVPCGTLLKPLHQAAHNINLFHVEQSKKHRYNFFSFIESCKKICSTWNIVNPNKIVPRGTNVKMLASIIILTGVTQSIIGIFQFIFQRSIGFLWLKESILSTNMPGVAKVILHNHVYIRAYGLFPHPNILGSFLAFSIIFTFFVKNCSTWNNENCRLFHMEQLTHKIFTILIIIQSVALLLTFSKSAIIGLIFGLYYLKISFNKAPRGTINNLSLNNSGTLKQGQISSINALTKRLLIFLILVFIIILIKPNINSLFINSLYERLFYLNASLEIILGHPFIGIGPGQYIYKLLEIPLIKDWQFQPVHNVFLLIFNEYGIFVFLGFVVFLYKLILKSQINPESEHDIAPYLKCILLLFIFVMMFDHFLWDIQQGQFMLWMLLGLLAA